MSPEDGRSAIAAAARAIADLRLGRLDDETTANVGLISGGTARNIVPEFCSVVAEARSHEAQTLAALVQEMVDSLTFAASVEECEVDITLEDKYSGYRLRAEDEVVRLASEAFTACGFTPSLITAGGGADANVFNAKGRPCANLANGMSRIHSRRRVHRGRRSRGDGRRDARARRRRPCLSPTRREVVYQGQVLGVSVEHWGDARREIVDRRAAVAILATDTAGNVVLVRQFREAVQKRARRAAGRRDRRRRGAARDREARAAGGDGLPRRLVGARPGLLGDARLQPRARLRLRRPRRRAGRGGERSGRAGRGRAVDARSRSRRGWARSRTRRRSSGSCSTCAIRRRRAAKLRNASPIARARMRSTAISFARHASRRRQRDQAGRIPRRPDPCGRARARAARPRGHGRDRRRRRQLLPGRRTTRPSARASSRSTRRGRRPSMLLKVKEPIAAGVPPAARRPRPLHLPPPRRRRAAHPRADRERHDRHRLRDGRDRRPRAAAARADERGRRAPLRAGRRAFPGEAASAAAASCSAASPASAPPR